MEKYIELLLDENTRNVESLKDKSTEAQVTVEKDGTKKIRKSDYRESLDCIVEINQMINDAKQLDLKQQEIQLRKDEILARVAESENSKEIAAEERRLKDKELDIRREEIELEHEREIQIAESKTKTDTIVGICNGLSAIGLGIAFNQAEKISVISSSVVRFLTRPFELFKK